jgi:hypothetical protein
MAKPYQLLTVELVSPAEVVDDFGDGFSGLGMTLVVGQLVVLDGRAVLVFALCGSQIHAYTYSVYWSLWQA